MALQLPVGQPFRLIPFTRVLYVGWRMHGALLIQVSNSQGDLVAVFGVNSAETMRAYRQSMRDLGYAPNSDASIWVCVGELPDPLIRYV
jgi:hypothetical protein